MKRDTKENTTQLLITIAALIPVIFICPNYQHGWGGDFSLYINEAIHIAEGRPLKEIGFIVNSSSLAVSPQLYPVGLPLILSPIYLLFGTSISAFSYTISFFLFLTGLITYLLSRATKNNFFPSFLGAMFIAYHPEMVASSTEVLPDIPLLFFLGLSTLLFINAKSYKSYIILSLVLCFSALIKSIGIAAWGGGSTLN